MMAKWNRARRRRQANDSGIVSATSAKLANSNQQHEAIGALGDGLKFALLTTALTHFGLSLFKNHQTILEATRYGARLIQWTAIAQAKGLVCSECAPKVEENNELIIERQRQDQSDEGHQMGHLNPLAPRSHHLDRLFVRGVKWPLVASLGVDRHKI